VEQQRDKALLGAVVQVSGDPATHFDGAFHDPALRRMGLRGADRRGVALTGSGLDALPLGDVGERDDDPSSGREVDRGRPPCDREQRAVPADEELILAVGGMPGQPWRKEHAAVTGRPAGRLVVDRRVALLAEELRLVAVTQRRDGGGIREADAPRGVDHPDGLRHVPQDA
jgi:hypothetical protein